MLYESEINEVSLFAAIKTCTLADCQAAWGKQLNSGDAASPIHIILLV